MSKAQRRLALLAAALGTFGAGALLAGMPAGADTKTVSYSCSPGGGTDGDEHQITVNLSGGTTATAGSAFTATLVITGASPSLSAPANGIPTGAWIQLQPTVSVSATPSPATSAAVVPSASASVAASLTAGAPLAPIPTVTMSVTPPAGATSMVLQARNFTLRVIQGAGTAVDLYTCVISSTGGGSTAPAALTVAVTTGSTSTSTSTPTSTSTATSTPRNTQTVTATVTAGGKKSSKVDKTPGGGAATGGGGDAGPDGRMFVFAGSIMVLGAAAGGLALRRRRLARG